MTYLIGTDEAGYGPNLGPLVISASVWQVPDGVRSDDLYRRLHAVVTQSPSSADSRTPMADSKVLYQSGKGLHRLERGLWAAWRLLGPTPRSYGEVWDLLAAGTAEARRGAFCDGYDDRPAPCDVDGDEPARRAPALAEAFTAAGVQLLELASRAVFPAEFNRTVAECGSKGQALSRWTLQRIARSIERFGEGPIEILCDKHGGRNHYLPLLVECFPGEYIETRCEGARQSVYRIGAIGRRIEICFQAKAESHLPAALASMASKYLRELGMNALNAFWSAQVPGLRPTAGYPQDARRFKQQIAEAQQRLGIEDDVLWRVK